MGRIDLGGSWVLVLGGRGVEGDSREGVREICRLGIGSAARLMEVKFGN